MHVRSAKTGKFINLDPKAASLFANKDNFTIQLIRNVMETISIYVNKGYPPIEFSYDANVHKDLIKPPLNHLRNA